MSKARAKGTAGENFFLRHLRAMFGNEVERAPLKGTADNGDFVNVPWQHEAKNTKKPLFLQWARVADKKSWPWVILWKGDLRKNEGPYVLMDLSLYRQLIDFGLELAGGAEFDDEHSLFVEVKVDRDSWFNARQLFGCDK